MNKYEQAAHLMRDVLKAQSVEEADLALSDKPIEVYRETIKMLAARYNTIVLQGRIENGLVGKEENK